MRKFLIIVNALLFLIVGFISWPGNKELLQKASATAYWIAAIVFIIGGTIANLCSNLIPYLNEKKLLKAFQRSSTFNAAAESFVRLYNEFDISLNVMVVSSKYLTRIEPKSSSKRTKLKFKSNVFEVVWQFGDTLSNQVKLTTNQAIYGDAFKHGHHTGIQGGIITDENFDIFFNNCTDDQKSLFIRFLFAGSCAIPNKNNNLKSIGILNIETTSHAFVDMFLTNPNKLKDLNRDLKNLAKIYEGLL